MRLFLISVLLARASAQYSSSCATTITAAHAAPSVADGYAARLVATNFTAPRGIKFDGNGTLLVVEQGVGITALEIIDHGGDCLTAGTRKQVIDDTSLNHGIEMSADGSTLYASSSEAVYSWAYDSSTMSNTSQPLMLVANMTTSDHTTRTLLLSRKVNGILVVTRGSTSNIDPEAEDINTGHSQIKAFDLANRTGTYDFDTDGKLLGWGLRNDVGIDEDPIMGGLYSVENSVDNLMRDGQDIHQNNPGEELNFLGYLNGTQSRNQGANFGYPGCYAAWNVSAIPNNTGIEVGTQFAMGTSNSTLNDTYCASTAAPRLTFQAHMAPLDILFNDAGTAAWITFHGSWDRSDPVGYKLSVVEFANGAPTEPSNSTTAAIDIVANQNNTVCPSGCFRPVGLAWDASGRLFMSSDATGEIYAILRVDGNSTSSVGSSLPSTLPSSSSGGNPSKTGSSPAATSSKSVATKTAGFGMKDGVFVIICLFPFLI